MTRAFAVGSVVFLLASACAEPDERDALGLGGADSQELLANKNYTDRQSDDASYGPVALYFKRKGYDLTTDLSQFAPKWPLDDQKTAVLARVGTPQYAGMSTYFHSAQDVMRSDPSRSDAVYAPHAGLARAFDSSGNLGAPWSDYSSVVAIYDPVSHVVTQLMHVRATDALRKANTVIEVAAGEQVGTLAAEPQMVAGKSYLRHTHLDFIDGAAMRILDPAKLFVDYHDSVKPTVKAVYFRDEQANRRDRLVDGKLDLFVEGFDRDDDSDRNLELTALGFELRDQTGAVLAKVDRCDVLQTFELFTSGKPMQLTKLMDLADAQAQQVGGWPGSNIDNRVRTFSYALTQLALVDGRCTVLPDAQGFVQISPGTKWVTLQVTAWDPRGNSVSLNRVLTR